MVGLVAGLVLGPALAANAFWYGVSEGAAVVSGGAALTVTRVEEVGVLVPGVASPLSVDVTNVAERPIVVTHAELSLPNDPAGPSGCPLAAFALSDAQMLPVRIPAQSSDRFELKVALSADAPAACQGADVPLRITLQTVTR